VYAVAEWVVGRFVPARADQLVVPARGSEAP
jgi:hypothetical protein